MRRGGRRFGRSRSLGPKADKVGGGGYNDLIVLLLRFTMKAYRTTITIDDPKEIILRDLPFDAGQSVEIVVVPRNRENGEAAAKLRALLRDTQALPQARSLTEDDIAAEVAAHRAG